MKFIFFGIIQGVTEFLPISSSGHLFLIQKLLKLNGELLPFFVFLHFATILTIIVFLSKSLRLFLTIRFLLPVLLATLISGIMGLAVKFYLKELMGFKFMLSFCFLVNAGILLSIKPTSGEKGINDMNLKDAVFLGFLQGFSPLPGISRSGITIAGALKRGFKPAEAFVISFLMGIPLIAGAFLIEFSELGQLTISLPVMSLGFAAAFVSGLLALNIVKKTLINRKFNNFAYYCLIPALLAVIL